MANFVIFYCERVKCASSSPTVNRLQLLHKQLPVKAVWGKQSLVVLHIIRSTYIRCVGKMHNSLVFNQMVNILTIVL